MPCVEWFDGRTAPTSSRCCRRRSGPGSRSRPASRWAGARSSARPARSSPSSTSAPRADVPGAVRAVRFHRRQRGRGARTPPSSRAGDITGPRPARPAVPSTSRRRSHERRTAEPPARACPSGWTTSAASGWSAATWQQLIDDQARRRRHQQPVDLPEAGALGRGRRLRRAGARPGRARASPSRRPSGCSPPTTSAGPATCCGRSTTRPAARTAGCRSRSTRGSPTTPTRPSPRPGAVVAGRPAERDDQDPGHRGRAARDHRRDRRRASASTSR